MTNLDLLGGQAYEESTYLKLRQNKEIIQLIKLIINPSTELDTSIKGYINVWTDDKGKPIGTCYTGKNGMLLFLKDFVATPGNLYPKLTDRHLKLLIYLISQNSTNVTFIVNDFNKACDLKQDSRASKRNYQLLDDLLQYQIGFSQSGEQIKDANKKDYSKEKTEVTFKPVINLKEISYNTSQKVEESMGVMITHTEVTTKLTKAKLEMCDILSQDAGTMYYHKDLLKLKQNSRVLLGAVSIAFNIYYTQSVNKKKDDNTVIFNVSTVLGWMGIYEKKYKDFLETSKNRGTSYFITQLNSYFKELEKLNIHATFVNIEKDKNRFYNKTQIKFDISDLKSNFK